MKVLIVDDEKLARDRNALVASRFIEGLERDENGHFQIRMRGVDERVDISRRHLSAVRKYVQTL